MRLYILVLVILVSTVSCGVIRNDRTQSEDQVEIMKREENSDSLSISVDKNQKISSESLVQGISEADLEHAINEVKRQTQTIVSELNKELRDTEDILRNSAHTSSVSLQMILGTVFLIMLKMI